MTEKELAAARAAGRRFRLSLTPRQRLRYDRAVAAYRKREFEAAAEAAMNGTNKINTDEGRQ